MEAKSKERGASWNSSAEREVEGTKAKILLDGGNPKVSESQLKEVLRRSGIDVAGDGADFGVVVGGDGRFSRYGRTEDIPLLFVGVRAEKPTGSKAFLAEAYFDELPDVLKALAGGKYRVDEHKRLEVKKNGRRLGEVFTDVYFQRGAENTCIRYSVRVRGKAAISEEAIGDGIIVTTAAGSTGYYSYPDRIKGDLMEPRAFSKIKDDEIGVCHVAPTYTERTGSREHPLRYTVPWGSTIDLSLFRPSDARLYGVTDDRGGIAVAIGDTVRIGPGRSVTKVVNILAKK